ncbi:MAG TPA: signal peptidase II [Acidimicrobiales bacterium]
MSRAEGERARWPLLLAVAAFVFAADQLSKWWAVETLDTRIIDVVGSLRFRLALNHGAAFSLSQGRGPLISVLALVVVAVLLRTGRHATRPLAALALGMVVGGALGNLADRAFREGEGFLGGGVVDFIDLQWWPIFNVADMGVVCGAILLVLLTWREPEPSSGAGDGGDAGSEAVGSEGSAGAGAGGAGAESSPSRV